MATSIKDIPNMVKSLVSKIMAKDDHNDAAANKAVVQQAKQAMANAAKPADAQAKHDMTKATDALKKVGEALAHQNQAPVKAVEHDVSKIAKPVEKATEKIAAATQPLQGLPNKIAGMAEGMKEVPAALKHFAEPI